MIIQPSTSIPQMSKTHNPYTRPSSLRVSHHSVSNSGCAAHTYIQTVQMMVGHGLWKVHTSQELLIKITFTIVANRISNTMNNRKLPHAARPHRYVCSAHGKTSRKLRTLNTKTLLRSHTPDKLSQWVTGNSWASEWRTTPEKNTRTRYDDGKRWMTAGMSRRHGWHLFSVPHSSASPLMQAHQMTNVIVG